MLLKTERMESRALPVEEARDVVGGCCVFFIGAAMMKAAVEIGAARSNAAVAEESFIMIMYLISKTYIRSIDFDHRVEPVLSNDMPCTLQR